MTNREGKDQVDDDKFFEVLPAGAMRAKYGLTAENRPIIKLDPANVPLTLRPLITLAEQFGIGDDLIHLDVVAKTPQSEIEAMRRAVEAHYEPLEAWLAGPEATSREPSKEYIAFTCLLMASEGC